LSFIFVSWSKYVEIWAHDDNYTSYLFYREYLVQFTQRDCVCVLYKVFFLFYTVFVCNVIFLYTMYGSCFYRFVLQLNGRENKAISSYLITSRVLIFVLYQGNKRSRKSYTAKNRVFYNWCREPLVTHWVSFFLSLKKIQETSLVLVYQVCKLKLLTNSTKGDIHVATSGKQIYEKVMPASFCSEMFWSFGWTESIIIIVRPQ